jgi:hypothetical protein
MSMNTLAPPIPGTGRHNEFVSVDAAEEGAAAGRKPTAS